MDSREPARTNVRYPTISDIVELMGLRQQGCGNYVGVFATGDFDQLCDYGVGLLRVRIHRNAVDPKARNWTMAFSISTIDDGVWAAFDAGKEYSERGAQTRVDEVARAFLAGMEKCLRLPTEAVLNGWLAKVGLHGKYTG